MLDRIWRRLKIVRKIGLGPVSMVYRFERTAPLVRPGRLGVALAAASPTAGPHLGRHRHEAGTMPSAESTAAREHMALPLAGDAQAGDAQAGVRGQTALIVGAGPGLGESVARRLAREGMNVAVAARNGVRLEAMTAGLRRMEVRAQAYVCDVTHETSVRTMFEQVSRDFGTPHLVVYCLQNFGPGETLDVSVPAFEDGWRHNCLGAFLLCQSAGRAMVAAQRGTIVLVGSTSSIIGREAHLNLAVGKAGQRSLAQVLSRELWPKGVHVAHVMIDADIRGAEPEDIPQAEPDDLAESIFFLHRQPRSAWTSELDLRPWNERFWEHC